MTHTGLPAMSSCQMEVTFPSPWRKPVTASGSTWADAPFAGSALSASSKATTRLLFLLCDSSKFTVTTCKLRTVATLFTHHFSLHSKKLLPYGSSFLQHSTFFILHSSLWKRFGNLIPIPLPSNRLTLSSYDQTASTRSTAPGFPRDTESRTSPTRYYSGCPRPWPAP